MSVDRSVLDLEDKLKTIGLRGSFIYFLTSLIIFVITVRRTMKLRRSKQFTFSESQTIVFGPHIKSQTFNRKVLIDVNGEVDAVGHANSKRASSKKDQKW